MTRASKVLFVAVLLQFAFLLRVEAAPSAADLLKEHKNSLVFVEGKTGQGSGFVADIKGQKVLLTNAHVVAGVRPPNFTLLDRTPVTVGNASAAVGHDIVALSVVSGGTAIPSCESVETEASIGDAVLVLGNAEGAGVVNLLQGSIVGIGPNLVEVDAPFVPGNSGSPILHLRSGKVIGIATYLIARRIGSGQQRIRRFGYRIDSVQKWQAIDWTRFYAEADAMSRIEKTSGELVSLLEDFSRNGRPTKSYEAPSIRSALDQFDRLMRRQNPTKSESDRAAETLLTSLRAASVSDVRDARTRMRYDFFLRQLETQERDREEISKVFEQAVKQQQKR